MVYKPTGDKKIDAVVGLIKEEIAVTDAFHRKQASMLEAMAEKPMVAKATGSNDMENRGFTKL